MTADERKALIYDAAERLFGERGYEKVTMADVATATGMSKRTLYLMFTDKEALLKGLIASSYIWPEGAFQGENGDRVEELRLRLRVIANHVLSARHINLCRLAIGESVGIEGLAGAFLEMGIGRSRDSLIQSIARIDKSRARLDLPPQVIAGMLYGATCAFNLMNALLTGARPDLAQVYETIDAVVDQTFDAR